MMKKGWKIFLGTVVIVFLVLAASAFFRDPEENNSASIQATSIQASNNSTATSAHSSSDNNMFLARRIGVISESENPIMEALTKNLIKELNTLPFVEEAELLLADKRPEQGALLHDLYILLEMPEFESSGLLATGRKVNAKISGSIGRNIWNSRTRVHDNYSASLVDPYLTVEINHESTCRGIESPNVKYGKVIESISEHLNEKVVGQLSGFAAKFRHPGDLPAGLYPEYRPSPELPEPWSERLVEVLNGRGFMLHNQTIHTMMSYESYEDLKETRQLLLERGWRMDSKEFKKSDSTQPHRFRATLDNLAIEAFEVRDGIENNEEEPVRLVYIYTDRMTQYEVAAAFQEAYGDEPIPAAQWIVFDQVLPKQVNERVLEGLVEQKDLSFSTEKRVIRYLERQGHHDKAVARLDRASLKSMLCGHEDVAAVKKLGREISGDNKWEPKVPTVEQIKELGVTILAVEEQLDAEVSIGETTLLMNDEGEDIEVINVQIKRSEIPEGRYSLAMSTYSINSKSRQSSSITPHDKEIPWRTSHQASGMHARWEIQVEEVEKDQFKLKVKRNQ